MAAGVKALTKIQVGKESTRGTAVAASRRLIGDGRYRRLETFHEFEENDYGVLGRTARAPLLTRNGTELEYRAPLSFEEILLFLLTGVKGGVTGTGAGADKTWTFTPSGTADPAPDAYTLEFVESDGSNNAEMEAPYMLTSEIEVTAGVEKVPELRAKMVGRKTVDSTLTAALAVPALNYAANLLWKVFFDPSWATLGATQISAQVYGFRWRWQKSVFPQYYLDGRTDLDFSTYHFGKRSIELELDVVSDAAGANLVQTEEALKTAGTARAVRCQLLGASLGGSNYTINLDGYYYHAEDSMQERGNDRDGNLVTRLHLKSAYDGTSTNEGQVIVVNALTSFP